MPIDSNLEETFERWLENQERDPIERLMEVIEKYLPDACKDKDELMDDLEAEIEETLEDIFNQQIERKE